MSAGRRLLLGLALLAAVLPLLSTWSAIAGDPAAPRLASAAVVAVLGVAAASRALRVPEPLPAPLGAAALIAVLGWAASGSGGVTRLPALLADGARHLASHSAPVPPNAGVTLLLAGIAGVLAWLTDLLVVTLDRPSAVVVPLLTFLLIPALGPRVHRPPTQGLVFFALGVGLVLLIAQWRPPAGAGRGGRLLARATALSAGVTALAFAGAVTLAPLVPVPASLRGPDGEPIQMTDVSLQLKREIQRGANTPAFDYATDDGEGAYLRLYSLPTFNADGWHLVNSNVQLGALPQPPGLAGGATRRTTVTITGFASEWLPAPYAPTATSAGADWGYLPDSLAILALGVTSRTKATQGLTYTVTSRQATLTGSQQWSAAQGATPPDAAVTASVPSDISPRLVKLAQELTAGAPTAGAKVARIAAYLARPEFTYSLDAQPGSGYTGLEDFLLRDHKGFCVQYAASLAILARIAGVPTRVAIGFTPGRRAGDHFTVTMHDMHAWPEFYLAGLGWVMYEATPGVAGAGGTGQPDPTASPSASPTPEPSQGASGSAAPTPSATPAAEPAPGEASAPGGGVGAALTWVAALVIVAGLGAAPALLRRRARAARLAPGRDPSVVALDAWAELRALARDHGLAWPEASSPRYAAETVVGWLRGGAAAGGVRELALAAERAQFGGPSHAPAGRDWTPVVDAAAAALDAAAPSAWARLRARWLPRSLLG